MRGGDFLILGIPGPVLDPVSRGVLEQVQPAGVILFRRNVVDAPQLRRLVADLRDIDPEVVLMADAEGGRVDRLAPAVGPSPGAAVVAAAGEGMARRAGWWIGRSLAAFDLDLDLAPVTDLDRGEQDNALRGRCWGTDPDDVTVLAAAFLEGLAQAGVAGCVKHFPGLGAAREDTHHHSAAIELDQHQLASHLEPFRRLGDGAGAVMISHAIYPSLDSDQRPASVSRAVATTWLRGRLGFRGVAISDDLEMHALAPIGDLPARALAAIGAGCDLAAVCADLASAPAVAAAIETAPAAVLEVSHQRLRPWRDQLAKQRQRREYRAGEITLVRRGLARLCAAVGR